MFWLRCKKVIAIVVIFYANAVLAHLESEQNIWPRYSVYSESMYDSRFAGAVTENRLRFEPNLDLGWWFPYAGLVVSQDLSNNKSPLLTENMMAPVLGLRLRPLQFLNFFIEARRLYRFRNDRRGDSETELRYGAYAYYFYSFSKSVFNETYAEGVTVDRVSDKPVASMWNKSGYRAKLTSHFRMDFYTEAFFKTSPDQGYGPDENEWRLGTRLTFWSGFWAMSVLVHHSLLSDVKPHGTDAVLVISRERF